MDEQDYEDDLEKSYAYHIKTTGKSYFEGQLDEGMETDSKGKALTINAEELE